MIVSLNNAHISEGGRSEKTYRRVGLRDRLLLSGGDKRAGSEAVRAAVCDVQTVELEVVALLDGLHVWVADVQAIQSQSSVRVYDRALITR